MADAKPSKSAKKREYLALQELGESLILLSDEKLADIDTDPYLIEQILHAKSITAHSALRRQKQLIGKIMREVDPEPISFALARFGQSSRMVKGVFKEAELWRDRIAAGEPNALRDFLDETGDDSALLPILIDEHGTSEDSDRRRHIRRKIFREIHRILLLSQNQDEEEAVPERPASNRNASDDFSPGSEDREPT